MKAHIEPARDGSQDTDIHLRWGPIEKLIRGRCVAALAAFLAWLGGETLRFHDLLKENEQHPPALKSEFEEHVASNADRQRQTDDRIDAMGHRVSGIDKRLGAVEARKGGG